VPALALHLEGHGQQVRQQEGQQGVHFAFPLEAAQKEDQKGDQKEDQGGEQQAALQEAGQKGSP